MPDLFFFVKTSVVEPETDDSACFQGRSPPFSAAVGAFGSPAGRIPARAFGSDVRRMPCGITVFEDFSRCFLGNRCKIKNSAPTRNPCDGLLRQGVRSEGADDLPEETV